MTLATDIQVLRARTLAELVAAHDYYTDSRLAWRLVRKLISAGGKIHSRSIVTGSVTTQETILEKSPGYVAEQLAEATFQQFISIFENFYFELLRLWLTAYPQSLGKKTLEFKAILELPDKEAITQLIIHKELNEILYDRPSGWFEYLEAKVKVGCPSLEVIEQIAEAKASRDVLVHNRGVANKLYLWKAGRLARFPLGEKVIVNEQYHRDTWQMLCNVVAEIADAVHIKA